jgi:hypothetical protein
VSGRRRPAGLSAVFCLTLVICACLPASLRAAAPWAEPLPWDTLNTEPGFAFGFQRFDDTTSNWQVDAFTLMSVMRQGDVNRFYLRWRHLDFNTGGVPLFTRWPDVAPSLEGDEEPDPDWPGETGIAGWGRPELGLLAPVDLPLLGASVFCGEVALPFASNDLYPFAARSVTVRFGLQRSIALHDDFTLALRGEQVLNGGAAGEDFSDEAFPAQTAWGAGLGWRFSRDSQLRLEGRTTSDAASRRLRLTLQLPLGDDRRLAVGVMHSLADEADRLFETRISAAITIGMPGPPSSDPETQDQEAAPQEAP